MTDAWRSIRLAEFEHVTTGQSESLLRVRGRAADGRETGVRPVLVVQSAEREVRLHPLSAPADRSGELRAAYAVRSALIAAGSHYWLELEDGARIELPTPVEGSARRRDGEAGRFERDERDGQGANEQASALSELQIWCGELERRLADTTTELGALRAARASDQRELSRLRSALAGSEPGGPAGDGHPRGGEADTLAAQAEEIQHLAAELAALRSRAARSS